MKTKTINSIIAKKFDSWVDSIEDEKVKNLVNKYSIITGGCIASMLLNEPVNDFDVYFRNMETTIAVADYYVKKFKKNPPPRFKRGHEVEIYLRVGNKDIGRDSAQVSPNGPPYDEDGRVKIIIKSAGIASEEHPDDLNYRYFEQTPMDFSDVTPSEYVEGVMEVLQEENNEEKPKYRPIFLSTNAITLSDKVQAIIRFYGNPSEIHENYDFVHCTNYWDSHSRRLILNQAALEALLTKELIYVGSKYPLASLIRTRKFIQRGWTINAGQYLKMAMQIHDLDLHNISVLEDQLIGMDAAYFTEILHHLKSVDPQKVTTAYLTEIVDRMF